MIEAMDVYDYFLCPYKVYNKHNADRSLMLPLAEFTKKIMKVGREHEKKVIFGLKVSKIKYPIGDFAKGFSNTVKAMRLGKERIYQGVLMGNECLGIPDLLVRQNGKSRLGNFHYIAADIKSSIRSKEAQIMQLMFYSMLLEKAQGIKAEKAVLVLKNSSELIELNDYEESFRDALANIKKLIKGPGFGLHIDSECKECRWREVCLNIARKTNDVSLVYGLSRPAHHRINEAGIWTIDELKKSDAEKLSVIANVNESSVERWKEQADVLLKKKDKINKMDFPKTENSICLDIETSEDGFVYLIGLWHNDKFKYFFSDSNEKKNVEEFIDYILSLKDCTLYHYGTFEKTVFRQLFEKYNIDEDIQKEIFSKMIDLFQIVKKNAVLPLIYYNLKDVAKHFGFKWRAEDASGSNSMLWYDEWKRTKDKKLLKKILNYNEDDVKATYIVLKKLSKDRV